MRTANFREDVLFPMAALLSITPDPDLSVEFARQWAAFVNTRLRYAWCLWDWPDLLVTQERAFRQVWRSDQNYFANDEVYHIPTASYYKAIQDVILGSVPTDTNFWAELSPVDKFIEYDQFGQQPIGEVFGVYNVNPRLFPLLEAPGLNFKPSEKGIDLAPECGPTVFIHFKISPAKMTTVPWMSGSTYRYGDVVYWTDGNCYQCGVATTTAQPDDFTQWFKVPLPNVLAEYVKTAAAGDAADDAQVEAILLSEAEEYLQTEVNKLLAQRQAQYYNLRQPKRVSWPYGIGGFWSVSVPWPGGFVSTLTDALYSPLPQDRRVTLAAETGEEIVSETGQEIVVTQ